MILCVGEILVDEFIDNGKKSGKVGGAPFNVAAGIASFGGDASFYGCVGNDELGSFLKDGCADKGLKNLFLETFDAKTSRAIVSLEDGERSFRFDRDDGTDFMFSLSIFRECMKVNPSIVHFGSLMLSDPRGVSFLKDAVAILREEYPEIVISFDINFRFDIFGSIEKAREVYKDIISLFDLIKISNDECLELFEKEFSVGFLKRVAAPHQTFVVSLGKEGSLIYRDGEVVEASSIKVKPIDTTGAGDCFYSYVLYATDKEGVKSLIESKNCLVSLQKANIAGAMATLHKGAIDVIPTSKQVDEIFDKEFKGDRTDD